MLEIMSQFYQYLLGQWCFYREIAPHGHAQGIAEFLPMTNKENYLYYQEQGQFFPNNQQHFRMQRDYIYVCEENIIDIYHARSGTQGDFFLKLVFESNTPAAMATHLCVKDLYQAKFSLINTQTFQIDYHVEGPKKNYLIHTEYLKMKYK